MWARILNILIGLLLMAAPALRSFNKLESNHNHIVGPLVVTFAITALWEVNREVRWVNTVLGVWLVLAPFILGFAPAARTVDIICGVLIAIFSLFRGKLTTRYGGGWKSLFQKNPAHMQRGETTAYL